MNEYTLIPNLAIAILGKRYYVYDRTVETDPIRPVPTREIDETTYKVLDVILQTLPEGKGRPLEAIKRRFRSKRRRMIIDDLVRRGYLEPVAPAAGVLGKAGKSRPEASEIRAEKRAHFLKNEVNHYFRRNTFFNLPDQPIDDDIDVGMVGLPVSSLIEAKGTELAPAFLRTTSQNMGTWFRIHEDGIFHEAGMDGNFPEILGDGIHVRDFGDIEVDGEQIRSLFKKVQTVTRELARHAIKPLFIGGDHAVTFPGFLAVREHFPQLGLLHLDAHNDLFCMNKASYFHSNTIHNCLLFSEDPIFSFGLRTHYDPRVDNVRSILEDEETRERVKLYSLEATRRFVTDPGRLKQALAGHTKRPYYLTIDLDVLSADAINYQVTTPAGKGLEWHELFGLLRALFGELNIVGCDVVEFNPVMNSAITYELTNMMALLVFLIDRLGKNLHTSG